MFFETFPTTILIVVIILLLALAALVAKRRMFRIDHLPPEHRAKENELFEAFGLETPPTDNAPKDHEKKAKELKIAFKSSKQF